MSSPLRVVHFVNQFFAGIGGEDQAHVGVSARDGAVGPGRALQEALGDSARITATIVGGDNFMSERQDEALAAVARELERLAPDVVVAGLGYVGLPLAMRAVAAGHQVTGYDVDLNRVKRLEAGESYAEEVPAGELAAALGTAGSGRRRTLMPAPASTSP